MPDEPNKNIESQLKAWAQKRRDEAGPALELHPATRRLLQNEVSRTFPKSAGASEKKSVRPFLRWPRFWIALPIVAVMAVMLALLAPFMAKPKTKASFELAQNRQLSRQEEKRDALTRERLDQSLPSSDAPTKAPAPAVSTPAETPALATERFAPEKSKASSSAKRESAEADARKDLELALADKVKETEPPLAQAAPAARGLNPENERGEVLLRQRYALAPQAPKPEDSVERRQKNASVSQRSETKATAGAGIGGAEGQLALNQAPPGGARPGAPSAVRRVTALAEQDASVTDSFSLAVKPSEERTVNAVSLGEQLSTRRPESVTTAFYAERPGPSGRQFAQTQNYRRNFNSPPMPDVLNSFRLEQSGQRIRIVDADNSIYEGQIEGPKQEPAVSGKLVNETPAVELKKAQPTAVDETRAGGGQDGVAGASGQNVWFRVSGTNRTLNQAVMFVGNLIVDTNAANSVVTGVTLAPQTSAVPAQNAPLQNQLLFQNTRVQGQVMIGASNRIEIDATAIAP